MGLSFVYECPNADCGSQFLGEMDEDCQDIDRIYTCEDCDKKFRLEVSVEPRVNTYVYRSPV